MTLNYLSPGSLLAAQQRQLALSLCNEVEALIYRNEGACAVLVLSDFREGLQRCDQTEIVQWCWRWMLMYKTKKM